MRILWVVVLLGIAPRVASAHLTVAVLGTAGADGEETRLIRISHGMVAVDGSQTPRFVCPVAWGGPERPLAAGGVVVGDEGVYAPDDRGALVRVGGYEGIPFAMTKGRGAAWLLTQTGTRSAVFRASADGVDRVFGSPDRREGIAFFDGAVIVAGAVAGGGLSLVTLSPDGSVRQTRTVTATLADDTIALVSAGELYVRARGATTRIGRIDDTEVVWLAESENALFGPTAVGDRRYVVEDGVLMALTVDGRSVVDDTRRYTCADDRIVCTLRYMYRLDEEGVGEVLFSIRDVVEPIYDGVDEPLSCEGAWIDFSSELQEPLPLPDAGIDPPVDQDGCGCTQTGRIPNDNALALAMLLMLLTRKRRR